MSNTTHRRASAETLVEQGRAAIEDARRPLLAVVGAGELAVRQIREQLRGLPRQAPVRRLSERAAELQGRVRGINPAVVRETFGAYATQVRSTYHELAEHGEKVVARSRSHTAQPGVLGALDALLGRGSAERPTGSVASVENVEVEVLPGGAAGTAQEPPTGGPDAARPDAR